MVKHFLSFTLVLLVGNVALAQQSSETQLRKGLRLREDLSATLHALESANTPEFLRAAWTMALQMRANGTKRSFIAAYFCSAIESKAELSVPVKWQLQIERILAVPQDSAMTDDVQSGFRLIGGYIVGKESTYRVAENFLVEKTAISTIENDRLICFLGTKSDCLSNLLIYSRKTSAPIAEVSLRYSEPVSGRPHDLAGMSNIYMVFDDNRNRLAIFTALEYSLSLELVDLDSHQVTVLFAN